jgi:hypothetical protein
MQSPSSPIMVSVVEKSEMSGLGEVILQAVGLIGAITIGAVLFGLLLAAIIIGYRKLSARFQSDEQAAQTQSLGLTPTGKS